MQMVSHRNMLWLDEQVENIDESDLKIGIMTRYQKDKERMMFSHGLKPEMENLNCNEKK